jgi:SCF-associated factor 1
MDPETSPTNILDLPVDILVLIFPYLDVASFLNLTSTCKALHSPDFTTDPTYWSRLVRRDFRVPNQPVVQNDGKRWQSMYKRLRTQTRVYTWGNNDKGCLGHSYDVSGPRRFHTRRSRGVNWPGMMQGIQDLGVVSDLQCGGWSTSMLTARGALYMTGVCDGLQVNHHRSPHMQKIQNTPESLQYPPGFPHPNIRYDAATAIKQFSAGRSHVLGLSDSGRIWSWQNIEQPALHVKFIHHNTKEDGSEYGQGAVKKVVAGWNKSAALIESTGVVVWEPLHMDPDESEVGDAVLVLETAVVPLTANLEKGEAAIGEVLNFTLLEDTILFNTSLGKAFVALITWNDQMQTVSHPVELPIPVHHAATPDASFVTDIQGSFRNFAVFTKSGAVLTSNQDQIMPLLQGQNAPPRIFKRIPALQNKQVISLAFGDYHFHALHAPGYITSYGNEPQGCGALGLGGRGVPESRLRGIRNQGIGGDGRLVPHAYTEGRRVWFEAEKRDWLTFLTSGGVDAQEARERTRMAIGTPEITAQGEISEWVEQEGRDWEGKYGVRREGREDDDLGSYFALSVTAAGWHSGALVLVNEEMAESLSKAVVHKISEQRVDLAETSADSARSSRPDPSAPSSSNAGWMETAVDLGRYFLGLTPAGGSSAVYDPNSPHLRVPPDHRNPQPTAYGASPEEGSLYVWANDHFPRLILSDGTEMPGDVPFDQWRYGRPQWKLNWEDERDADGDE